MIPYFKNRALVLGLILTSLMTLGPRPAQAYQVDCAILLCLSGGWPASAPCAHARTVFIRRITPWPIEPPLQIWRCPMRTVMNEPSPLSPTEQLYRFAFDDAPKPSTLPMSRPILAAVEHADRNSTAQGAIERQEAAVLLLAQSISDDNGTADIDISGPAFDFVRTIKVWRVDHYEHRERGRDDDCTETDRTYLGTYGEQGDFHWAPSSGRSVPVWMGLSTSCHSGQGLYRGVGIEWHDYEGRHGYELVRY